LFICDYIFSVTFMNKPFLSITKSTILGVLVLGLFLACGTPAVLMAEEVGDVLDVQIVEESSGSGPGLSVTEPVETKTLEQTLDENLFENSVVETEDQNLPDPDDGSNSDEAGEPEAPEGEMAIFSETATATPALSTEAEETSSTLMASSTSIGQASTTDATDFNQGAELTTPVALTAGQTEVLVAISNTLGAISEALAISDEVEFTTEAVNEESETNSRVVISEEFGAGLSEDSGDGHETSDDAGSENSFQTESASNESETETAVSVENIFQTEPVPVTPRKISAQMSFITQAMPEVKEVISAEHYFNTLSGSVEPKVSQELTFTTADVLGN
jgi:hypothetical protein